MKRFLLALLSLVASAGLAWAAERAVSQVYRLRMRSMPDKSGRVVGYLAKGEAVSVLQKSSSTVEVEGIMDSWYDVINSSGTHGWVFGGYLKMVPK